ncbi:unnamed protein product [Vicia faba]|uniref:Uncharacterized protein n=1 Tax=Vicia faba TaxID=3906 RepID=A0AAV0ZMH7_VICFA|nr:unnamed protein product [Vicia faba]
MTTPYENMRLKRMAENKKKLEALNLLHSLNPLTNHLSLLPNHHRKQKAPTFNYYSQIINNPSPIKTTITSPPIQTTITPPPIKTTITSPPIQTTITPPLVKTTITPPPIQTAKDVVVEYEDEDVMEGDETEDDVSGDEAEDVVVGDEAEDVVVGDEAEDVVVGDETKDVWLNMCIGILGWKSEPDGTWIILDFDKDHCAIGQAYGLLAGYLGVIIRMFKDIPIIFESWKDIPADTKTNFYESKIKRHFLVDHGRDKEFIFASASNKLKDS